METPSSEPYVGTIAVVDRSPDGKPHPTSPPSQTVTVPPNSEGMDFKVSFRVPGSRET